MKFFASILIGLGLLGFAFWIGWISLMCGCFTYWLFRDASIKKQFDGYVREYDKNLAKTRPKLNHFRRFLSKIVFGMLVLILITLVVLVLGAIIDSLFNLSSRPGKLL